MPLDVLSRFVHVATAITLVGGSVFMLLVLLPAAKTLSEETHRQLAEAIQSRWKRIVHVGILLFLASGFYNYFRAMPQHEGDGLYHGLVGAKILLALGVFFIASALVGRSNTFRRMRQERGKWVAIMVLLATLIVAISGYVKVRGPISREASIPTNNESGQ